jgi:anti-sigma regulatory factor (Ser/Thr protein kinase)
MRSMLSVNLQLERDKAAPARARTMVRGLEPLLGEEKTEDATLLVSELVTNAVRYGGPPVRVRVACGGADGAGLQVAVSDGNPDPPVRRDVAPEAEGGRGVALVDIISDRWGVEHAEKGKTVWFVLS